MSRNVNKYLLFIGVTVALLPIITLRDFTPANELRYLSIADEALRNHTFFAFTNQGVPYADKPPLYIWIVMLCRCITDNHHMWLLSLFSLLPAFAIVRTMDRWTEQEMDNDSRLLAQWMLLTCGLFIGAAVTLRMDMLMCCFVVLALHAFWQMAEGEKSKRCYRWLFPLYLFLALFTKGPLGLLIPLCSTTAFLCARGRIHEFFRYWGWRTWGILLSGCALWFTAAYIESGAHYLCNLLFQQTAGRAVNSFHHAQPFYYYALHIWYCLAPWSLLVIGVVAAALRPRFVRSDLQCFFLTVSTTTLILLSAISSKLQIYMLPAVPFLVYSAAMFMHRFKESKWLRMALVIPAVLFSLVLLVLTALGKSVDAPYLHDGPLYAAAAILTLCGAHSLYLIFNRKQTADIGNIIRHLGTGLLAALFVAGWGLPHINKHIGYGALCSKALSLSQQRGINDIRSWHLSRAENMDVYLHHRVTVIEDDKVPAADTKPYLLLTPIRYQKCFPDMKTYVIGPYAVVVVP